MGDGGGLNELVLHRGVSAASPSLELDATYGDLLLRDDYCAVLAPHSQRCDVRRRDCLECILCVAAVLAGCVGGSNQAAGGAGSAGSGYGGVRTDLVEATLVREDGNVSVVACASCMTRELLAYVMDKHELGGAMATDQT